MDDFRTRKELDDLAKVYLTGPSGQGWSDAPEPNAGPAVEALLLGHLPGVQMSHEFLPRADDRFWTPADWAWIGGLMDVLMPALYHGVPVVSHRFEKFTGEAAFDLINRHGIRNAFLPPTALKLMRSSGGSLVEPMRSIASAGEAVGGELLEWGKESLEEPPPPFPFPPPPPDPSPPASKSSL